MNEDQRNQFDAILSRLNRAASFIRFCAWLFGGLILGAFLLGANYSGYVAKVTRHSEQIADHEGRIQVLEKFHTQDHESIALIREHLGIRWDERPERFGAGR